MRFSKYLAATAAASLAVAPAMAAPTNPAASLSVAKSARASAPVSRADKAAGGGVIVAVLAAAAVIAGIVIIADSDDDSESD